MDKVRALFMGRFQPFHLGHLKVIENIAAQEEADGIVIGIGSALDSHTLENPFTAGERIMMINNSITNIDTPMYLIAIPDIYNNAVWVPHVISLAPKFQIIYSGNKLVRRLFEEHGIDVREHAYYNQNMYSGTEIRKRIVEGKEWEDLVPEGVVEVINSIGGVERIRELA